MKALPWRYLLALKALLLTSCTDRLGRANSEAQLPPVGRYQMLVAGEKPLRFDPATGQSWVLEGCTWKAHDWGKKEQVVSQAARDYVRSLGLGNKKETEEQAVGEKGQPGTRLPTGGQETTETQKIRAVAELAPAG